MADFNEQLISLVQSRPLLYNCKLPDYKNDRIKENIWIWYEIAEALQASGESAVQTA